MNTAVLFSSDKADWETPQDLFEQLDKEFHFDLDVAANEQNYKCENWLGPGTDEPDALKADWNFYGTRIWCNPPYGRGIGEWLNKALYAATMGATVVVLLPARTDTKWFQAYAPVCSEVRFLAGRLTFGGAPAGAPFPSCLFVFRPLPAAQTPYRWTTWRSYAA